MCKGCKIAGWTAYILAAIGAINWGLVAFLRFNVVYFLSNILGNFGLDRIIYALVALSGIYLLVIPFIKDCKICK